MKKDVHLKGMLRLYMQWPAIMSILLIAMNLWIYSVDKRAGVIMSLFVAVYIVIVGVLYFYNKSIIFSDLVDFAAQYGSVQNVLLKELQFPYAILLEDGQIIWNNTCFSEVFGSEAKTGTYLSKYIQELNRSVFPKEKDKPIEKEVSYNGRDYRAILSKVPVQDLQEAENILQMRKGREYFVTVTLSDVTEMNEYIRANEEQKLVAGLIYIDNYDEVMESVEEVRQSLLVALIDRKINQYMSVNDGIVKKLEKDKYFFVIKKGLYFVRPVFRRTVLLESCGNGSSEMVSNLSMAIVTFLFNLTMLRLLGEDGVAAITIVLYGQFLFTSMYLGFSMGVAPVFSFNYGDKNYDQLKRIYKICMYFITVSSIVILVMALVFAEPIVGIFSGRDSRTYEIAADGFFLFSFNYIFAGINIFASAMFTAFGDGKRSAIISFCRTFIFIVVSILVLPLVMGVTGVWLSVPLAEFVTLFISIGYFKSQHKKYHYA